jgi:hypothetical protein
VYERACDFAGAIVCMQDLGIIVDACACGCNAQNDLPVDQPSTIKHASASLGDSLAVVDPRLSRSDTFSLDTDEAYQQDDEELNAPKLFTDEDELAVLPARITRSLTMQLVTHSLCFCACVCVCVCVCVRACVL